MPIFVSKGVSSVSMRELSKELGVSTGTLYHYFPTKEILFESMVKQFVAIDEKEIRELSETQFSLEDIMNFVSKREEHFMNLVLLAVDVKRQLSESSELAELVEDSFVAYRTALDRFFPSDTNIKAGKAFLSFFIGALFLKNKTTNETEWPELFESLGNLMALFQNK
ncbi:TetR/AcrR family transcriptional regulator [Leptospira brenneri]|uniref:TetR/AcrR family transcriptional regulator n=1 Tax=Leptospira brenneri TaxID=2023182 RepID=A0A2M9Y3C0_9LEPT|nr:TetR/AcrR family transcriptional regulator [Leptospira brenneri]PJZ46051.1 AcrR family transcriptional regulator [Leptospira brenneri]TGK91291.1 TetR/AcrR family transcriptional regulator [Leptospira brenneri]